MRGGRLVADARDQQPFELGEWGLRVVLSGHFCTSLHVGHARRKQAGIKLQKYLPEAQIKTNKVVPYIQENKRSCLIAPYIATLVSLCIKVNLIFDYQLPLSKQRLLLEAYITEYLYGCAQHTHTVCGCAYSVRRGLV